MTSCCWTASHFRILFSLAETSLRQVSTYRTPLRPLRPEKMPHRSSCDHGLLGSGTPRAEESCETNQPFLGVFASLQLPPLFMLFLLSKGKASNSSSSLQWATRSKRPCFSKMSCHGRGSTWDESISALQQSKPSGRERHLPTGEQLQQVAKKTPWRFLFNWRVLQKSQQIHVFVHVTYSNRFVAVSCLKCFIAVGGGKLQKSKAWIAQ